MIFLLVYDRKRGALTSRKSYRDACIDEANRVRLETEIANANNSDVEVVILQSKSLVELKKTHARYFKSLEQLRPA